MLMKLRSSSSTGEVKQPGEKYPLNTVPFTPKVNTQTHFVFLKCAAARQRAMCEIHMYGQRTFGAVPILNLSLGARKCDHV